MQIVSLVQVASLVRFRGAGAGDAGGDASGVRSLTKCIFPGIMKLFVFYDFL